MKQSSSVSAAAMQLVGSSSSKSYSKATNPRRCLQCFPSSSSLPSPPPSSPSSPTHTSSARTFSTTSLASAKARRVRQANDPFALNKMPKFNYDDVPTLGHAILEHNREMLKYARLGEWELPKLKEFAQPYKPPSPTSFLRFRFQHYQGEMHPASRKVVLEFPVRALFASGVLTSPQARRKFLLLAQDRWDPERRSADEVIEGEEAALEVASDAKISQEGQNSAPAQDREQGPSRVILQMEKEIVEKGKGWIKIGCETFPLERQNMKWCSDVLDKLIAEANQSPFFEEMPLDMRAEESREAKRRGFDRRKAPTLKDFPKEWLGSAHVAGTGEGGN